MSLQELIPLEEQAASELLEAVALVPSDGLSTSLERVARKLPVGVGVETAAIRLRDSDGEGLLHLVAIEGSPAGDRRNLLHSTQTIAQARSIFALGHRHSLGRAFGFTWLHGEWIKDDGQPLGAITVGSRTERRPTAGQAELLREVCDLLGPRLRHADRRTSALEAVVRSVARASVFTPAAAPERVRKVLRPRELTILTLYTEGHTAVEIADLFVISPHTVRTHIKNAYRRLGVHTRAEAARVIRAERLLDLV
jgi:DNA-binding CsgD family transcriptional regulator